MRKSRIVVIFFTLLGFFFLSFLVASVIVYRVLSGVPSIEKVRHYSPPLVTQIISSDGVIMGEFFKENRKWVKFDDIPDLVKKAFMAAEDARFYQHSGLDFKGIVRAAIKDIMARRIVQGGSTITQQVTKILLLSPERSFSRKIKEMYLAYKLEKYLTKDKILELYMNLVYLGNGAYGVETASEIYFGKGVTDLTLAEAAMLAGLPKAPTKFSPVNNPERAKERQIYVLKKMLENGWITEREYEKAVTQPLIIRRYENPFLKIAPYATEEIRKRMVKKFGEEKFLSGGLRIYTTINVRWQKYAQEALREGLKEVDKRIGYRGPLTHVSREGWEEFLKKEQKDLLEKRKREILGSIVLIIDSSGKPVTDPVAFLGLEEKLFTRKPEFLKGTLLKLHRDYRGLITRVDRKSNYAVVRIGNYTGILPGVEVEWARKPDPETPWWEDRIKNISQVVKPGDVVLVKVIDPFEDYSSGNRDQKEKLNFWKEFLSRKNKTEGIIPLTLDQEPDLEGAVLAVDPYTGAIRVAVGGYDFRRKQFNHAFQAHRQVGSAFKPIVYTAALLNGYTPASLLKDIPVVYAMENTDADWRPHNYSGNFKGTMLLIDALTYSKNIVTVRVAQDIGLTPIVKVARDFGIVSKLNPDLSMALGSSSLYLWELVRAYSVFDNYGYRIDLGEIKRITGPDGKVIFSKDYPEGLVYPEKPPRGRKVLDPDYAYLMNFMLKNVVEHGTGWRARQIGRPAAGKTGTTNDHIDAWFIGYIPQLVCGVWVGYDEEKSMGVYETGGIVAAPIWVKFMKKVVKDIPEKDFPIPPGIVFKSIDPATGLLASELTPNPRLIPFIKGTEPTQSSHSEKEEKEDQIIMDDMGL